MIRPKWYTNTRVHTLKHVGLQNKHQHIHINTNSA